MSLHKPMEVSQEPLDSVFKNTEQPSEIWQGLSPGALRRFGVLQNDVGTYFPYYRHGGLTGFKVRKEDADHSQRFFAIGDMDSVSLFGQTLCSSQADALILTEGEKDAISAWYMTGIDSVSIPTGATIKKDGTGVIDKGIKEQEQFLRRYQKIYLCLDQDEPGQAVATALSQWLGNSCQIVRFPLNDVNEMLKEGQADAFKVAIENSQPYRPTELLTPRDLRDEMLKPVDKGIPYPWPSLNRLLGGMREGEVVGWGAGVKVGKTNSAMQLTEHLVNSGQKVGLFYLENQPVSTMQIVAGKMMGDMSAAARDRDWTPEEVDEAISVLDDKVWIYNTRLGRDWATIKPVIRWLSVAEGVKFFFIDPLTALAPGDASQANAFLMDFFKEATALAMELGIHINYYSHLNPPKTGNPHEEGGMVQAIQFTGSRAMIRYSSAIIGVERNVVAEDPEVKNRSTLRVLLAREIGTTTGQFWCYYNEHTGAFSETPVIMKPPESNHTV